MKLSDILSKMSLQTSASAEFEVSGVQIDSRKIKANEVFFAIKGDAQDGHNFIDNAIENGAKVVFCSDSFDNKNIKNEVLFIKCADTKEALHKFLEIFYSNLSVSVYAVTGTNGKTSVANFAANISSNLGFKAAGIGTLGVLEDGDYSKQIADFGLTSPDVVSFYEFLKLLDNKGYKNIFVEASSHGLEQKRFGNFKFDGGAFTNLTQDHLDYHKTMEAYFLSKSKLFDGYIKNNGAAIFNSDSEKSKQLIEIAKKHNAKIFDYGMEAKFLKINYFEQIETGLEIEFEVDRKPSVVKVPVYGAFQVHNLACALLLAGYACKIRIDECVKKLANIVAVCGRMEPFITKKKAYIFIDYAHTPDALEKAILSIKPHVKGKLSVLFGCGGDRDKTKRPIMGKIASEFADNVIVTDDNPRTEDAKTIRKEIISGILNNNFVEVAGRKEAIENAFGALSKGDGLLLAGKGHEDYQVIGKEKFHFSEHEILKALINK